MWGVLFNVLIMKGMYGMLSVWGAPAMRFFVPG
jgi:hypothetical protein